MDFRATFGKVGGLAIGPLEEVNQDSEADISTPGGLDTLGFHIMNQQEPRKVLKHFGTCWCTKHRSLLS